ncbi:hypothetical protein ABPG77_003147 [Micractinium sp. CCAP 211/92]
MSELDELIEFLSDQRPPIAQHAAELVQGLTGSPEGVARLAGKAGTLMPPLLRLVPGPAATSRAALVALVNLSQEPAVQQRLLELNAVGRCMDYVREKACVGREDLLIMLLANLTALEAGAEALLQVSKGPLEGLHVAMLLKLFLAPVAPGTADIYEHVATILPNVTRFSAGRRLLLQPGRGLLQALASQLRSGSELRRRGCAGAIKNCCFSCEQDGTANDIAAETEALSTILDVLCGITAKIADEPEREALAEAVLCLARVDSARKQLWKCDAPTLLQKGYEYEENPTVCACMEGTAELFLADGFEPAPADADGPAADADARQDDTQNNSGRIVQIEEID